MHSIRAQLPGATIDALWRDNGTMSLKDLEELPCNLETASCSIDYNDVLRIYGCGTPASSSVVLSALKILEGYEESGTHSANLKITSHG